MVEQRIAALMAHLIQYESVPPEAIENAVNHTLDIQLGESICGNDQLVRAFVQEQTARLTRKER